MSVISVLARGWPISTHLFSHTFVKGGHLSRRQLSTGNSGHLFAIGASCVLQWQCVTHRYHQKHPTAAGFFTTTVVAIPFSFPLFRSECKVDWQTKCFSNIAIQFFRKDPKCAWPDSRFSASYRPPPLGLRNGMLCNNLPFCHAACPKCKSGRCELQRLKL